MEDTHWGRSRERLLIQRDDAQTAVLAVETPTPLGAQITLHPTTSRLATQP